MTDLHIRDLARDDVVSVAKLISQSYDRPLHPFLTYCQPGVRHFLEDGLKHGLSIEAFTRSVALFGSRVVGFAEWRVIAPDRLFLSHICVAQTARSMGVASAMLRHHLGSVTAEGATIELDVFTHNDPARRLYERLGLEIISEPATWVYRPLGPVPGSAGALDVYDDAHSLATYERYGFTFLGGEREGIAFRVGLIGPRTVRALSGEDFTNEALLSAVRSRFPSLEQVLFIVAHGKRPPENASVVLESVRMRSTVKETTGRLE